MLIDFLLFAFTFNVFVQFFHRPMNFGACSESSMTVFIFINELNFVIVHILTAFDQQCYINTFGFNLSMLCLTKVTRGNFGTLIK